MIPRDENLLIIAFFNISRYEEMIEFFKILFLIKFGCYNLFFSFISMHLN